MIEYFMSLVQNVQFSSTFFYIIIFQILYFIYLFETERKHEMRGREGREGKGQREREKRRSEPPTEQGSISRP